MIHRDAKPANILRTEGGSPKLTDLGLERREGLDSLTSIRDLLDSAHYLAPELSLDREADGRTDLYALGISLYEMTVGRPPYDGGSFHEVAERHLREDIPPPSASRPELSPTCDALVASVAARRPEARCASAREAEADVRRALLGEPLRGPGGVARGDTSLVLRRDLAAARARPGSSPTRPFVVRALQDGAGTSTRIEWWSVAHRAATSWSTRPLSCAVTRRSAETV